MTFGPSANQPKAIRGGAEWLPRSAAPQFPGYLIRLQAPSVRNGSKCVPSSQDHSGSTIPRLIETKTSRWRRTMQPRQMNEDGLDVREANDRVQGRPSAEHLPFPRLLNFLG